MDLSNVSATPKTVDIGGKDYQVGRLRFKHIAALEAYLKLVIPSPIKLAATELEGLGLPKEDRQYLLENARKETARSWPPDINSDASLKVFLGTIEGQIKLIHVVLGIHQPNLTEDDARRIQEVMFAGDNGPDLLGDLIAFSSGRDVAESDPT